MPRSVVHEVDGGELRVWRTSDDWLHAKLAVTRTHLDTPYDVEARWDIPPDAPAWSETARRARDGDSEEGVALADAMFTEAVAKLVAEA